MGARDEKPLVLEAPTSDESCNGSEMDSLVQIWRRSVFGNVLLSSLRRVCRMASAPCSAVRASRVASVAAWFSASVLLEFLLPMRVSLMALHSAYFFKYR